MSDAKRLTDEELATLERLEREAWVAPWVAHTFEIDCPCPNGAHCGETHSCEQVEAPEAYPASPEDPAAPGDGQCVVQIAVPGLESLAGPTAAFIVSARNALPSLLAEVRASRASPPARETAADALRALDNIRLLVNSRKALRESEWALHLLRFCREGGSEDSILRAASPPAASPAAEDEATPRSSPNVCACGHTHLAGTDGEDEGCCDGDCDCWTWTAPASPAAHHDAPGERTT